MTEAGESSFNIHALADARLAAIVDSSFDAIISKDLNSVITSWNAAAERVFGYSAEEAVGRSILMLIPQDLRADEDRIIAQIKNGERIESFETVRLRKDGSTIHVSLTISPIKDKNGRIVGASKIARDISATRESERRIRLLMREVNHRVKNQFSVILSMVRATARNANDMESFKSDVIERVLALARSHDLLVESEWAGAGLKELVQEHLKPFGQDEKTTLSGPAINLAMSAVQHLGMAFHELATNSAKHGALCDPEGRIDVDWRIEHDDGGTFHLNWRERFGSRPVPESRREGFGTIVLRSVTPSGLFGTAELKHAPTGFDWTLRAPLSSMVAPIE